MLWLEQMMNVLYSRNMHFLDQELTTDTREGSTPVHLRLPNYSIPLPNISLKTHLNAISLKRKEIE